MKTMKPLETFVKVSVTKELYPEPNSDCAEKSTLLQGLAIRRKDLVDILKNEIVQSFIILEENGLKNQHVIIIEMTNSAILVSTEDLSPLGEAFMKNLARDLKSIGRGRGLLARSAKEIGVM